jgi:putative phosphoesterase
MTVIGIISDTHGLLRPEAVDALRDVAHIIHAGDVGRPEILDELRAIAPLSVVRGNVDLGDWAEALPDEARVSIEGRTFYVLHNLSDIPIDPKAEGIAAVISGHTHNPLIETRDGVLYINPGSAGPRRFTLPISIGYVRIADGSRMEAWTQTLGREG